MDPLEKALIAAMQAKDSRGLLIRLISSLSSSPKDLIAAAQRTLDHISTPSTDPAVEANRLTNRKLCLNVIREARAKITNQG